MYEGRSTSSYSDIVALKEFWWKHASSPTPNNFQAALSAGKVMTSVFGDSEGTILVDYTGEGAAITGQYYAKLIHQLQEAIKVKRHGKTAERCSAPSGQCTQPHFSCWHPTTLLMLWWTQFMLQNLNCFSTQPTHQILLPVTSTCFLV